MSEDFRIAKLLDDKSLWGLRDRLSSYANCLHDRVFKFPDSAGQKVSGYIWVYSAEIPYHIIRTALPFPDAKIVYGANINLAVVRWKGFGWGFVGKVWAGNSTQQRLDYMYWLVKEFPKNPELQIALYAARFLSSPNGLAEPTRIWDCINITEEAYRVIAELIRLQQLINADIEKVYSATVEEIAQILPGFSEDVYVNAATWIKALSYRDVIA